MGAAPRSIAAAALAALATGCFFGGEDLPAPRIAAIVPPAGAAGVTVMIEGDHFCPIPDVGDPPVTCEGAGGLVRFGVTTADTTRWADQEIEAIVPALPTGRVPVSVIVGGSSSNLVGFDITP